MCIRDRPSEPVMEPEGFDPVSTGISLQRPQISVLGALLATSGTLGLAASGIAWNFKGIEIGLTGTLTSLLALAFSVLFLWPAGNKKQAQPAQARLNQNPSMSLQRFWSSLNQIPAPSSQQLRRF